MKGELRYVHSKLYSRVAWVCFYVVLILIVLFGLHKVVDGIQTHSFPAGNVQLSVPYSEYLVGEVVTFTIKNNFNSPIHIINSCPAEPLNVYRQDGSAWVRIHDVALSGDCPTENRQITVAANGSVNGNFAAWPNLFKVPGRYRVVAYVEYYDSLPYQEFEVSAVPTSKPTVTPGTNIETKAPSKTSPIYQPNTLQPTPAPTDASATTATLPEPNDN